MAKEVRFLVFGGFQLLDLTGPFEVFSKAELFGAREPYRLTVVSRDGGLVRSSSGMTVDTTPLPAKTTTDTLVTVGGDGVYTARRDASVVAWLVDASSRARRTASVCTGAFLLAEAGLLDGRKAVTHWSQCERLAAEYPDVHVDDDPIFVRDGDIWTSAGVTAGMDLALAMVEADHGAEVARAIAKQLVMFVQRPGGQAQFSAQLAAQRPARSALREAQEWIADHLCGDLSVPALAAVVGMSERNFGRAFHAEVGVPPAAYVESARVEAARLLLETTDRTVEGIARDCGFGTVETMHRSFKRVVKVTPGAYRQHFRARAAG